MYLSFQRNKHFFAKNTIDNYKAKNTITLFDLMYFDQTTTKDNKKDFLRSNLKREIKKLQFTAKKNRPSVSEI